MRVINKSRYFIYQGSVSPHVGYTSHSSESGRRRVSTETVASGAFPS
jgi:hypothetical protein